MIQFDPIINALGAAIFIHDAKTAEVLYVSKVCEEMYGISQEELVANGLGAIQSNNSPYNMDKALEYVRLASSGEPQVFEWKTRKVNGTEFWVEVVLNPYTHEGRECVVATVRDISNRKESIDKVKRSEQFQKIVNTVTKLIFPLIDEQDVLWQLSESCGKELGLEDMVVYMLSNEGDKLEQVSAFGKKVHGKRKLINPISLTLHEGVVGSVAKNKKSEIISDTSKDERYINDVMLGKSEITVPIIYNNVILGVIDSEDSNLDKFTSFHQEILEVIASLVAVKIIQARSYQREKENQESMNAVLYANPDLVFVISKDWKYREVFTRDTHMLAAPREELIGNTIDKFLEPNEVDRIKRMIEELLNNNSSKPIEYRRKSNDGKERWFSTKAAILSFRGEDSILLMSRDITEAKLNEFLMKDREKLLASINENITEGIYRSVPKGSFKYVNDAFMKMFGYSSKEELLGIDPASLYAHPKERDKVKDVLSSEARIKNNIFQFRRKDGSTFWGAMSTILTKDLEGAEVYDGAIRDITEEREIQIKVEENEKILTSINKNISEGIYRSYSSGGLIYVNDAFARMFGYKDAEDILKVGSLDLYADPLDRRGETPEVINKGYRSNVETRFKRKDGSVFWGLNSFVLTQDNEGVNVFDGAVRDISEAKEAAEKLNSLNEELIARNKILALKEQELASSNEELRANGDSLVETLSELSERNFELDQLVYKTSHDLRAPLRSVLGLTNLMKAQGISFEEGYIAKIEERILKMDDFIKAMLSYSKTNRMDVLNEDVDFDELISDCLKELEYLENFSEVSVQVNFKNGITHALTDRLRNKIIIGNLISNAYKYRNKKLNNSFLNIDISIEKKGYSIKISDNGIGIEKVYIDKVFDMFFRATEKSDGSGLGMYIVKQAVEKLKGHIEIESKVSEGTIITIEIPIEH